MVGVQVVRCATFSASTVPNEDGISPVSGSLITFTDAAFPTRMIGATVVAGDLGTLADARAGHGRICAKLRHIERPLAGDTQLEDSTSVADLSLTRGRSASIRAVAESCRMGFAVQPCLMSGKYLAAIGAK